MRAYRFPDMQVMVVFLLLVSLSAYGFVLYRSWQNEALPDDLRTANEAAEAVMSPQVATPPRGEDPLLPSSTSGTSYAAASTAASLPLPLSAAQEVASFRLDRERQRDSTIAEIKMMLEDTNLSSVQRDAFQSKFLELHEEAELELRVEQLLQSKGFEGAMLIHGEQYYSIIVPRDGLTASETIQIAELAARVIGNRPEDIVIVERGIS